MSSVPCKILPQKEMENETNELMLTFGWSVYKLNRISMN